MTEKTLKEVLDGVQHSTAGLLLEVKGLRTHMGSSIHFLIIAIEDLQKVIEQIKASIP